MGRKKAKVGVDTGLERQLDAETLAQARAHRARSIVLAAVKSEPRTVQELRALVAADLGEHRSRRLTGTALRPLRHRQLAFLGDGRWAYGARPSRSATRPLTIRGACERCGELHIGPCS